MFTSKILRLTSVFWTTLWIALLTSSSVLPEFTHRYSRRKPQVRPLRAVNF